MFGIAARRARRTEYRAQQVEAGRLTNLATELRRLSAGVPRAVVERRLAIGVAVILLLIGSVVVASAVAAGYLVRWDLGADVPTGRYNNTIPLGLALAIRLVLALLAWAGAVAVVVGAHRSIHTARTRLATFRAEHTTDLPDLEPLLAAMDRTDATLQARVRAERTTPTHLSTTDLDAAVPPHLVIELRALTAAATAANSTRAVSSVLAVVFCAVGMLVLSFGVVPAVEAGWNLGADVDAGRFDGFLPLWFVVSLTTLVAILILGGAVGRAMTGFLAVRTATDRLVRFQIEHEAEIAHRRPRTQEQSRGN